VSEALRALVLIPIALLPAASACGRHLGRGLTTPERLLFSLSLAPFALGLAGTVALAAGLPLTKALAAAEGLWIIAALWPQSAAAKETSDDGDFPAATARAVVALALAIVAVPLLHPFIRVWSDAWFHSAAAIEVARAADVAIVVLGERRREFGLLADAASEVLYVPGASLAQAETAWGRAYVRGVSPDGVIVLSGEALLTDPRLTIDPEHDSRPAA